MHSIEIDTILWHVSYTYKYYVYFTNHLMLSQLFNKLLFLSTVYYFTVLVYQLKALSKYVNICNSLYKTVYICHVWNKCAQLYINCHNTFLITLRKTVRMFRFTTHNIIVILFNRRRYDGDLKDFTKVTPKVKAWQDSLNVNI